MFNGAYTTLANPAYCGLHSGQPGRRRCRSPTPTGARSSCPRRPTSPTGRPNTLVDDYNQIVQSVAAQYPYVSIDDLYTVLDPGGAYSSVVDGIVARGSDGVHITQAAVDDPH